MPKHTPRSARRPDASRFAAPSRSRPARRPFPWARHLAAAAAVLLALTLSACGDGGGTLSPDDAPAAVSPTVILQPDGADVDVGDTVVFDARVTDGDGATLRGYRLSWSVSDSSAAQVDQEGRVVGRTSGEARVIATASHRGGAEASGDARISVRSKGTNDGDGTGPASGSGADPIMVEDFSTYTSTADLLSDPLGVYDAVEDLGTSNITLDTSTGVDIDGYSLSQSMRYTFPNNGGACEDQSISRSLDLPSETYVVWVEWYARFDADFTTDFDNANCTPAYKFLFGGQNAGRFDLVTGLFNRDYKVAWPSGNVENVGGDAAAAYDGQWHRYRIEFRHESVPGADDGAIRFWVDGDLIAERTGLDTDRSSGPMQWIELGANLNQGPNFDDMGLNWGRVAVWTSDPGW